MVIRKLLQSETVGHKDIISHMARLMDNIKIAMARASILWLLGEYCDKVPKIAPDVLRKMAKTFVSEVICCRNFSRFLYSLKSSLFMSALNLNFFLYNMYETLLKGNWQCQKYAFHSPFPFL